MHALLRSALVALLFVPLAAHAGGPSKETPAEQVAALFSEAGARVQGPPGKPAVYPIKRGDEWGYARDIRRVDATGFQVLAFELMLAKLPKKEVASF